LPDGIGFFPVSGEEADLALWAFDVGIRAVAG